jgi:hypothetical protein
VALREYLPSRRKSPWLSVLQGGRATVDGKPQAPSVGALAEALRAEGYDIAHGVTTSRGKVDHVVFGPTGTFAIQQVSWSGKVAIGSEGRLSVGGRDEHPTVRRLHAAAVDLQGRLSRAGVTPFVEAFLVVDGAEMSRPRMPIPSERVTVMVASELHALVRAHSGRLSPAELDRARVALCS